MNPKELKELFENELDGSSPATKFLSIPLVAIMLSSEGTSSGSHVSYALLSKSFRWLVSSEGAIADLTIRSLVLASILVYLVTALAQENARLLAVHAINREKIQPLVDYWLAELKEPLSQTSNSVKNVIERRANRLSILKSNFRRQLGIANVFFCFSAAAFLWTTTGPHSYIDLLFFCSLSMLGCAIQRKAIAFFIGKMLEPLVVDAASRRVPLDATNIAAQTED